MSTSPQWGRTTKQLIAATLLVLAGLLVYSFRAVLPLLTIAFLIAYVLSPVVDWASTRLRIKRGLVTVLLYLIGLALLATVPALVVPSILDEIQALVTNLGDIINRAIAWLDGLESVEAFGYEFTVPEVTIPAVSLELDRAMDLLGGTISPIAGGALSVVRTVALGVGQISLLVVISFYLLTDADRLGSSWKTIVPPAYHDEIGKLIARVNRTWNAFLRGQLVLCTTIGLLTFVATSALGLRFSIALGIIAGILEIIPSLGPTLAAIPAIVLALFQGSSYLPVSNLAVAIIVAGTYWAIQSIENNLLVPRIMGSTLNLHPAMVIIGVLVGITLGGILGALLASPILASLRHIMRYVYFKLADADPFPPPPSFAEQVLDRDIRAVLFDLDGTLLDTDDMLVDQIAGKLRPLAFLDRLYARRQVARRAIMALETPINLAITMLSILRVDKKALSWGKWLRAASGQRSPAGYVAVSGVVKLIQDLSKEYNLAIITTRDQQDTMSFVERFGLQNCFATIVTRQDVRWLKPHREPILRAAEQLGYAPEQCIVVGDTTVDVQSGKKAGAMTVAVLCGFGERAELERLGPDLILDATPQLIEHLPNRERASLAEW
jgi:HAD superfamily hydrolase (TIGR01509 family)